MIVVFGMLGLAIASLLGPSVAWAQEDAPDPDVIAEEETTFAIFGRLSVAGADARGPAEGVTIIVVDAEDAEVGTAVSDADGQWEVAVPTPGVYVVQVDVENLPEGIFLGPGTPAEREVDLGSGRDRIGAIFALSDTESAVDPDGGTTTDSGSATTRSEFDRFLQLLVEGIRFGLLIGLMAIGLSLIFGTTGLTNFAHAEMVTFGALAAYFFNVLIGVHMIPATILAVIAGTLGGALLDLTIFRPLRKRGVSLIAQLVITIGLSILLRYGYLYVFAGEPRSYLQYAVQEGIDIGPVQITVRDLWIIAICLVVLLAVGLLLQKTRVGTAMRAVADNRDLAESSGINVQRVILEVWALGGGLAALSGVLFGMSESIAWNMGFKILLLIFAGVTLGGLGTAFGAAVGSLFVGIFIQLSTMVVSPELKNVGALFLMILVLVIRPQGILGRSERVG